MYNNKLFVKFRNIILVGLSILLALIFLLGKPEMGHAITARPTYDGELKDLGQGPPASELVAIASAGQKATISADYSFQPRLYSESTLTMYADGTAPKKVQGTNQVGLNQNSVSKHTYFIADFVGYYKGKRVAMKVSLKDMSGKNIILFGVNQPEPLSKATSDYNFLSVVNKGTNPGHVPTFLYEYFDADTMLPMKVKGYFTFSDLDASEFVGMDKSILNKVYATPTTKLKYSFGKVGNQHFPPGGFYCYSTGIYNVATNNMDYHVTYTYEELESLVVRLNNDFTGSGSRIIIAPYAIPYFKHPAPVKEVDTDTSDSNLNFEINHTLSPRVKGEYILGGSKKTISTTEASIVIEDEINPDLQIKSVKVFTGSGINVTKQFTDKSSSNKVKLDAKSDFRDNMDNYGSIFTVRVATCLKPGVDYSAYYNAATKQIEIPNQSSFTTTSNDTETSNEVVGLVDVGKTDIKLTKTVDKPKAEVGDTVTYTIKLKNNSGSVLFSGDLEDKLDSNLQYVQGTTKVKIGGKLTTVTESQIWNGNTFKYKNLGLDALQEIEVSFKVKVLAGAHGKKIVNEAKYTGKNLIGEPGSFTGSVDMDVYSKIKVSFFGEDNNLMNVSDIVSSNPVYHQTNPVIMKGLTGDSYDVTTDVTEIKQNLKNKGYYFKKVIGNESGTIDEAGTEIKYYFSKVSVLHLRQVILKNENPLVVPSNGYFEIKNSKIGAANDIKKVVHASSGSGLDQAGIAFSEVQILRENGYDGMLVQPLYPEYYKLSGHVVTKTNKAHKAVDRQNTLPLVIDCSTEPEYWVTIYLEPTKKIPEFYGWSYGDAAQYTVQ